MLYTIAVQKTLDAERLAPVGPTSEQPEVLPLKEARARYPLALVVPWEERDLSVHEALERLAEQDAVARDLERLS